MVLNPRVETVEYQSGYRLQLKFANGEIKIFDLKPYLDYPVYQDLKDESFCAQASVFNGVVVWGNEIDIDPDRLYLESVPAIFAGANQ